MLGCDDSADEIVVVRLGHLDRHQISRVGEPLVDVDLSIDLRGLPLMAANQQVL